MTLLKTEKACKAQSQLNYANTTITTARTTTRTTPTTTIAQTMPQKKTLTSKPKRFSAKLNST